MRHVRLANVAQKTHKKEKRNGGAVAFYISLALDEARWGNIYAEYGRYTNTLRVK